MRVTWRGMCCVLLLLCCGVAPKVLASDQDVPVIESGQYERSNIILIELADTRRDHLGAYGYDRPTSPNLDGVARRGVRFEHVVAAAPWCVPGKLAIWTGLYPSEHGVVNKYALDGQGSIYRANLSAATATFPQLLKEEAGYTLVAFTGGAGVSGISGLNRAFDIYVDDQDFAGYDRTVPLAAEWLTNNAQEPFFMFLQGYTAHGQAIPEKPYQRIFAPEYTGALTGSAAEHKRFREESLTLRFHPDGPQIDGLGFSPEDKEFYIAIYDEKVQTVDWWVGEFLKTVEELDLLERTIVVIFSGHGDEYFDHGFVDHGPNLYEEVTHVPMFLLAPGMSPGRLVTSQMRTIDIFPTLFDLIGLSHHPVTGVSFLPALNGQPMELTGFSETEYRLFTHKSAVVTPDHHYKFIYTHDTGQRELYDLVSDPTEQHNVVDEQVELAETLERTLQEIRRGMKGSGFLTETDGSGTS